MKQEICKQDEEDFEQEKLIQEWLEREGRAEEFESKYISRNGTARNTIDKRSLRLDAKVFDDSSGTFADIIAGSDGRDFECGCDPDETIDGPKSAADRLDEEISLFFDIIGVTKETKEWAKKSIKSATSLRSLPSLMKEEKQSEISPINLEWPRRWGSFRK